MSFPWQSVGIDVTDQINIGSALEAADLNYTVSVVNSYYKMRGKNYEGEPYKFIIRRDLPAILGFCKGKYVPLQNSVLVGIAQPWIDNHLVRLDTIGSFNNGAKVWILLKLVESFWVELNWYILLVNGHDGNTAIQLGVIPFRLVCGNQLVMVGKNMTRFKHTENATGMLTFFRDELEVKIKSIPILVKQMQKIQYKPCSEEQALKYFKKVLKIKSPTTRQQNILNKISSYFDKSEPTYWSAYNAINSYLNYDIGRNDSTRLHSLWFGPNKITNERALYYATL